MEEKKLIERSRFAICVQFRQIQTAAGHHLLIDTGGKSHGREKTN